MFKKREILLFFQDRFAVTMFILVALGALFLIIMTALSIRVSDVQVPVRYSGYGLTNLYRDRWYALLAFGIFPLLVLCVNGYLALRLHSMRRGVALGLLGVSLLCIIVAIVVANAVFRLAALSL